MAPVLPERGARQRPGVRRGLRPARDALQLCGRSRQLQRLWLHACGSRVRRPAAARPARPAVNHRRLAQGYAGQVLWIGSEHVRGRSHELRVQRGIWIGAADGMADAPAADAPRRLRADSMVAGSCTRKFSAGRGRLYAGDAPRSWDHDNYLTRRAPWASTGGPRQATRGVEGSMP